MEVFFAKSDQILNMISAHSPAWIYLFVLVAMTIENFFPPFPGDTLIFICGVYAAGGHASWSAIYAISVVGTVASVMVLYYIGKTKGRDVLNSHRMRFLGVKRLDHVEKWFDKYHDKVLLASRWLTGVRSLIGVMAGVARVPAWRMLIYTTISTITWNFFVLFLARRLREDWGKIEYILATYNRVVIVLLVLILGFVIYRIFFRKKSGDTV